MLEHTEKGTEIGHETDCKTHYWKLNSEFWFFFLKKGNLSLLCNWKAFYSLGNLKFKLFKNFLTNFEIKQASPEILARLLGFLII